MIKIKIIGIVGTKPADYMLKENPFEFLTEFDKWFWYMECIYFKNKHWFTKDEIPIERCKL